MPAIFIHKSKPMIATLFNITYMAELCAFIAALLLLDRKTKAWQSFIPFLFIVLLAETAGWYYGPYLKQYNDWVYNMLYFVNTPFFIYIFSRAAPLQGKRRMLYLTIIFFLLLAFLNICFFEGFRIFNSYTKVLGDIILAALSCYFFYSELKEEGFRDLFHYEYFWLANGLLFYSLGAIILYLFLPSLRRFYEQTHIRVYTHIAGVLNILLYSSLIIAFICRNRATR
jgi:hypothetical protein